MSMSIKSHGIELSVDYEWVDADDSVGRIAHAELGTILPTGIDDISRIIAEHVRDDIAARVTAQELIWRNTNRREERCDD